MQRKSADKSGTISYMYEQPLHKGGIATGTKAYYCKRGNPPPNDVTGVSL